ncbi:hypothetical protein [Glycomyces tritici]|uniref:DUF4352 domain-containing protein n=1 Tax=Glycomyces tritici TaxID=2665176 RepID=A0ABT7YWJ8_9ACTN|nr:hypothetical protein [Glycomyces tritici]MDN3242993.1 hypothetical protein [Glycomyces tritici]
MTPSPEPAAPRPPRIPDWVFALGLAVSLLVLVFSPLLTVAPASFLDPRTVADAESVPPDEGGTGDYAALAEVLPEEEPPAASTVAVADFGYDVSVDGTAFTWGASIRNTHGEYAARFGVQVSVDGVPLYEEGGYTSTYGTMTPPGGEVRVGNSRYFEDLPSDPVVAIEVVRLEWFAFDDGTPPEPQAPPLGVRVDGIDEGDEPRGQMRFSVTVANSADHAIDPWLMAVFHRADGTPVGGARLFTDLPVPPGESVREFRVWKQDVPAGADLSLTEFVPSW